LNEGNKDMLFVTAIYALYEPSTGQFDFVNAGHVKPILLSSDGHARWLDSPKGTALGARPNRRYAAAHLELQPGDTVLMITDGVTEALNDQFEEFGLDRVMAALDGTVTSSAKDCIDRLLAAVDTFTGGVEQSDDITCMAICHRPTDVCMAA
jgi:sigma-B regulation protein RsbU (phosphoserine phosphatase)